METRTQRCNLCHDIFQMSEGLSEQREDFFSCDECTEILDRLEHRHSLSIDVSSQNEFHAIVSQLTQLAQPRHEIYCSHHSCFSRASRDGDSYWLCYYYDRLSIELLKELALLRTRYTLHDRVTHEDSLRFWPDYSTPQGTLALKLQRI